MAQSLKAGETVTVSKDVKFEPNTPEYKNGLRSIKVGEIGTVVDAAIGRSVVVEFGGNRITIGSQRLKRVTVPGKAPATAPVTVPAPATVSAAPPADVKVASPVKPAQPAAAKPAPKPRPAAKQPPAKVETPVAPGTLPDEEGNTELVATLANSVLLSGGLKSAQDTMLQVRLSDLPRKLQNRITELVQAKLDLGTKKSPPSSAKTGTATAGKKTRRR